jgi:hypothetical protein
MSPNHAVEFGARARPERCQPAPSPVGTRPLMVTEPWAQFRAPGVVGQAPTTAPGAGALPQPSTSSRSCEIVRTRGIWFRLDRGFCDRLSELQD